MKVVWLGQAGVLFISGNQKILIDPYLSDSLKKIDKTLGRAMPINRKLFKINPDVVVLTSFMGDHTDTETIAQLIFRSQNRITFLCSENAYAKLLDSQMPKKMNCMLFDESCEWTVGTMRIRGIKAKSPDRTGFGVLVTDTLSRKTVYVTSQTLYAREILAQLPKRLDVIFVPISGEDGCMNQADASRFAKDSGAKIVVPTNFGMFNQVEPELWDCENKLIPKIYQVLPLFEKVEKKPLDRRFNEIAPKQPIRLYPSEQEESEPFELNALTEPIGERFGITTDEIPEEVSQNESSEAETRYEPDEEIVEEPTEEIAKEPDEEIVEEPTEEIAKEPDEEIVEEPSEEIAEEVLGKEDAEQPNEQEPPLYEPDADSEEMQIETEFLSEPLEEIVPPKKEEEPISDGIDEDNVEEKVLTEEERLEQYVNVLAEEKTGEFDFSKIDFKK